MDKKIGNLNISTGARYEYFSLNSETKHIIGGDTLDHFATGGPVFRGGLNYQIGESTFIRSSWGQGYRFPSMAELFVSTNASGIEIYSNPELKPETYGFTKKDFNRKIFLDNYMDIGHATIKEITNNLNPRYTEKSYISKSGDTHQTIINKLDISKKEKTVLLSTIADEKSLKILKINQKFTFKFDNLSEQKLSLIHI